jgi:hypothetical protein
MLDDYVTYSLHRMRIDDSNTTIGDIGAGFMSLARVNYRLVDIAYNTGTTPK